MADPYFRGLYESPFHYITLTDTDDTVYHLLKQIILLANGAHPEAEALCSLLTTQVLLLMARKRSLSDNTIDKPVRHAYIAATMELIQEHFSEHITVKQIAAALHVQPTYLHRLFKEYMGITVGQYITQKRIQYAKELLTDTDNTLLNITAAVGLSSQQRFSKIFRSHVGLTLSEYRRKYRGTKTKRME
jgi:AraC-like DNA-binding protein